jgi:hypothetical protein
MAPESPASRVTIDIDPYVDNWELKAIRAWHALDRAADRVEVRISSSGAGLHIIGKFQQPLTDGQKDRMRRNLCDDPDRIFLDAQRDRVDHSTQVLWTTKPSGTIDTDFDSVYQALDHIKMSQNDPQEVV